MKEIIEDGSLARLVLVLLVFGTIAALLVMKQPVDDRLIDIALVILGFYFRTVVDVLRGK